MEKKVVAVDFDGTICENAYPSIGRPNRPLIEALKFIREKEIADVILYTCRTGVHLEEAIEFCIYYGLEFDAVNQNLPRIIDRFGGDTRKIFADLYIDDKTMDLSYDEEDYEFFYRNDKIAEMYVNIVENALED